MSVLEDGKIDGAVSLSVERVTRKIAECSVRWLRKGGGIDPLHELLTIRIQADIGGKRPRMGFRSGLVARESTSRGCLTRPVAHDRSGLRRSYSLVVTNG